MTICRSKHEAPPSSGWDTFPLEAAGPGEELWMTSYATAAVAKVGDQILDGLTGAKVRSSLDDPLKNERKFPSGLYISNFICFSLTGASFLGLSKYLQGKGTRCLLEK